MTNFLKAFDITVWWEHIANWKALDVVLDYHLIWSFMFYFEDVCGFGLCRYALREVIQKRHPNIPTSGFNSFFFPHFQWMNPHLTCDRSLLWIWTVLNWKLNAIKMAFPWNSHTFLNHIPSLWLDLKSGSGVQYVEESYQQLFYPFIFWLGPLSLLHFFGLPLGHCIHPKCIYKEWFFNLMFICDLVCCFASDIWTNLYWASLNINMH